MRGSSVGICICALTMSIASGVSLAGEKLHPVAGGESVSFIAQLYYGDFDRAELLLQFNDRSDNVIRPGEVLKIPFSEKYTVRSGDSWSGLARRFLGRASAYPALATLNQTVPERSLRVGEQLRMPFVMRYRLQRGESLATVAARTYGDPGKSRMLAEFNRIDDPRSLAIGTELELPIVSVDLVPMPEIEPPVQQQAVKSPQPEVEAEPAAEPAPAPAPRLDYGEDLGQVAAVLRAGDFLQARQRLEALGPRIFEDGTDAARASHSLLLASVYVAFDRPADACRAFATGDPASLDPVAVSPKIREILGACP